jgi:hypothetical protein
MHFINVQEVMLFSPYETKVYIDRHLKREEACCYVVLRPTYELKLGAVK